MWTIKIQNLMFAIPKCLTRVRVYNVTNTINFIKFFFIYEYLGQHVSTPTESSSGPSKNTDP
jgi:hypothetical protein